MMEEKKKGRILLRTNMLDNRHIRAVALSLAVICASVAPWACTSSGPSGKGPTTASEQAGKDSGFPREALEAYQAARRAVRAGDMAGAVRHLSAALEIKPDFTEAWYNRGAAYSHLAIAEMRKGRESESLAMFRAAVADKKRAQELINQGKWFVYKTAAEQDQVKSDLANALEEADDVLADEQSLIAALKLYAALN